MKSYSSICSKFLRTSTAVALITVASLPAPAMDEGESFTRGYIAAYKSVPFSLKPVIQDVVIEGDSKRIPTKENPWRITTDNNNWASYQLESDRFEIREGQRLRAVYNITVEKGGKMSLGFLNTGRVGWYPSEREGETEELILTEGSYQGIFEKIIPAGESITSLVFRNYHLGEPGQTTFTVEELEIAKTNSFWLNATGLSTSAVQKPKRGPLTVITDNNDWASYQIRRDQVSVQRGDHLSTSYKLIVQPGGKISMGYLSTSGTWWYGGERVFAEGTHEGVYTRFVPEGEEKTSLVVRNYHLSNPGQSTFTIEYLDLQQENFFSGIANELVYAIAQNCHVQEALSFSSTNRRYRNVYDSNPLIWSRLMETHNYPMPKLGSPTKLNFMSHHLPHRFGYYSFNDPKHYENPSLTKSFSIPVKSLVKLFEMFPLGPSHQSFFNIGEDTFSLYWTASVWLPIRDGQHLYTSIPTKKHNMEHFPNGLLDVSYLGANSFLIRALIQKAKVFPYSYVISSNEMGQSALSYCKTPEECMERAIIIIIKKENLPPV